MCDLLWFVFVWRDQAIVHTRWPEQPPPPLRAHHVLEWISIRCDDNGKMDGGGPATGGLWFCCGSSQKDESGCCACPDGECQPQYHPSIRPHHTRDLIHNRSCALYHWRCCDRQFNSRSRSQFDGLGCSSWSLFFRIRISVDTVVRSS